jgi:hypothetical protein
LRPGCTLYQDVPGTMAVTWAADDCGARNEVVGARTSSREARLVSSWGGQGGGGVRGGAGGQVRGGGSLELQDGPNCERAGEMGILEEMKSPMGSGSRKSGPTGVGVWGERRHFGEGSCRGASEAGSGQAGEGTGGGRWVKGAQAAVVRRVLPGRERSGRDAKPVQVRAAAIGHPRPCPRCPMPRSPDRARRRPPRSPSTGVWWRSATGPGRRSSRAREVRFASGLQPPPEAPAPEVRPRRLRPAAPARPARSGLRRSALCAQRPGAPRVAAPVLDVAEQARPRESPPARGGGGGGVPCRRAPGPWVVSTHDTPSCPARQGRAPPEGVTPSVEPRGGPPR